jgi:hypothetical protein
MSTIQLSRIWLTPPLAFARLGSSPTPCAAFSWGPNDLRPDGTGTTTLTIGDTLDLDPSGDVTRTHPDRIVFRDEHGIRPVCPYFELHGTWTEGSKETSGPITLGLLKRLKLSPGDLTWDVHFANLKSHDYTYEEGDRIDAKLTLDGDDTTRHTLEGRSPAKAKQPLVPKGAFVPMGAVQIAKPSAAFPEIRLRFYAPAGLTYGPKNLPQRIKKANMRIDENKEWRDLKLPPERLILNSKSAWAKYVMERSPLGPFFGNDNRHAPWNMFAVLLVGPDGNSAENHALGLVDDTGDGVITCSLKVGRRTLKASARVVTGPPDYAPANRTPVSLADNLADREDRASPRSGTWTIEELRELVLDIFERALETSSLSNKDAQNIRCHDDNMGRFLDMGSTSPFDAEEVEAMLWPDLRQNYEVLAGNKADPDPHELAAAGERKHRRYATIEYLENRFRENPELFHEWIRRPFDPNPFYDRRMPALMKGADTRPLHLTRRQWEIMRAWVGKLRETAPPPAPAAPRSATASEK